MKVLTAARLSALILAPVLALAALTGCSTSGSGSAAAGSADAAADAAAADAPWSYTDDTGTAVTLNHRPTNVASYADYAIGLLSYGIDPVAIFGRVDVASDASTQRATTSATLPSSATVTAKSTSKLWPPRHPTSS